MSLLSFYTGEALEVEEHKHTYKISKISFFSNAMFSDLLRDKSY